MADDRDAELAQRAREGDAIARQLLPPLMGVDTVLDGSVESLRLIDGKAEQLREVAKIMGSAKDLAGPATMVSAEGMTMMLGSYIGEMARRGLEAKGVEARWEAGGEGRISMAQSHLVIRRGEQEGKWAVFSDVREWLNGSLQIAFYDSMKQLLSIT